MLTYPGRNGIACGACYAVNPARDGAAVNVRPSILTVVITMTVIHASSKNLTERLVWLWLFIPKLLKYITRMALAGFVLTTHYREADAVGCGGGLVQAS